MANTDVHITEQDGQLFPDVSSVPIVAGDTVTFYADPDHEVSLCMTRETTAIFVPRPDVMVTIATGASVMLTFTSAPPAAYCIAIQPPGEPCATIFCETADPTVLNIFVGITAAGSGPDTVPQT